VRTSRRALVFQLLRNDSSEKVNFDYNRMGTRVD